MGTGLSKNKSEETSGDTMIALCYRQFPDVICEGDSLSPLHNSLTQVDTGNSAPLQRVTIQETGKKTPGNYPPGVAGFLPHKKNFPFFYSQTDTGRDQILPVFCSHQPIPR